MKSVRLGKTNLNVPSIVVGCMRLAGKTKSEMNRFIRAALDRGANYFDHADIYGDGQSETVFGDAFAADPSLRREDVILQSKCGIRKQGAGFYDQSKSYILSAVDGILKRLKTDYIDVLLLHRPDALVEPEEVAAAFDLLQASGKVRFFGVSNHRPSQIELLKKFVKQDLIANQIQFSLAASAMIASGMEVNMTTSGAADRDGSVLDYCRLKDITPQAWSPFQIPAWQGSFLGHDSYAPLNEKIDSLAAKYQVTPAGIAAAWILRHPANFQVIAGTSREDRLLDLIAASDIVLTRAEWYELYLASGHILP